MSERSNFWRRSRRPVLAAAAVACFALAWGFRDDDPPTERVIGDAEAAELIKKVPINQSSDANGIRVSRYNTIPRLPGHNLWGVVQYCTKEGGQFVQLTVTQAPNSGDPADVTNATRAEFQNYENICTDNAVSSEEVRKITVPAPLSRQ